MFDRKAREALGRRMQAARIEYLQPRLGRNVALRELGEMVTAEMGGRPKLSGTNVLAYLNGEVEHVTVALVAAYAAVCGVDPCWLAFGHGDAGASGLAHDRSPLPGFGRPTAARARGKQAG